RYSGFARLVLCITLRLAGPATTRSLATRARIRRRPPRDRPVPADKRARPPVLPHAPRTALGSVLRMAPPEHPHVPRERAPHGVQRPRHPPPPPALLHRIWHRVPGRAPRRRRDPVPRLPGVVEVRRRGVQHRRGHRRRPRARAKGRGAPARVNGDAQARRGDVGGVGGGGEEGRPDARGEGGLQEEQGGEARGVAVPAGGAAVEEGDAAAVDGVLPPDVGAVGAARAGHGGGDREGGFDAAAHGGADGGGGGEGGGGLGDGEGVAGERGHGGKVRGVGAVGEEVRGGAGEGRVPRGVAEEDDVRVDEEEDVAAELGEQVQGKDAREARGRADDARLEGRLPVGQEVRGDIGDAANGERAVGGADGGEVGHEGVRGQLRNVGADEREDGAGGGVRAAGVDHARADEEREQLLGVAVVAEEEARRAVGGGVARGAAHQRGQPEAVRAPVGEGDHVQRARVRPLAGPHGRRRGARVPRVPRRGRHGVVGGRGRAARHQRVGGGGGEGCALLQPLALGARGRRAGARGGGGEGAELRGVERLRRRRGGELRARGTHELGRRGRHRRRREAVVGAAVEQHVRRQRDERVAARGVPRQRPERRAQQEAGTRRERGPGARHPQPRSRGEREGEGESVPTDVIGLVWVLGPHRSPTRRSPRRAVPWGHAG
ncbi:hypothetical protein DFJ74DRAFT_723990, partial [Hyaloraphidium curvatum]